MRKLNRRIFDLQEDITYYSNKLDAALHRCGFRLSNYVAKITGKSYRKAVEAIASGVTEPNELIKCVHGRIINKHGKETLLAAMTGSFSTTDVTVIRQYWELLTIYARQSDECQTQLTALCETHFHTEYRRLQTIPGVKERAAKRLSDEELAVFDAHLMMAEDPEFASQIKAMIENDKVNAEYAADTVANQMVAMFEAMDNDYFRERAADIKDVTFRLKCNLLGLQIPDLTAIDEPAIIVAHDLTPSDTAQLNEFVKGFATAIGGKTSHSAIMANSLEIPAVVGTKGIMENVKTGDVIGLDAIDGFVYVNPDEVTVEMLNQKSAAFAEEKEALKMMVNAKSITTDGHEVELAGNIGGFKDVEGVLKNGGEGVGLFRTEFLYMDNDHFPTEEEQFEAYKAVLEGMGGRKVVVRTLDIGGDKKLSYYTFPEEMNPFLGYRAIRLCLKEQDIFRTQLRALCRASVYGKLCIMFPMIATIDEFRQPKCIF